MKIDQTGVEDLETMVRKGQGHKVKRLLEAMDLPSIPSNLRLPLANLSRRLLLPNLALRILSPNMHLENRQKNALPAELVEYSFSLLDIGAFSEAERLLQEVDLPEAILCRSFAFFKKWHYGDAVPLLVKYIEKVAADPYKQLIGQVNLSAALIFERRTEEAENLLNSLRSITLKNNYEVLHSNCLELSAQVRIQEGRLDDAWEMLLKAREIAKKTSGKGDFYVKKWLSIVSLLKNEDGALEKMRLLRDEAFGKKLWEMVRYFDLKEAIATEDKQLLQKVYVGTPYKPFRKNNIEMEMPAGWVPPKKHVLKNGKPGDVFDLYKGESKNGSVELKTGQQFHRCLAILLKDFYHPPRIGQIFATMFPGEHFDPFSSTQRVHQLLWRLRGFIEKNKMPIEVKHEAGFYSINMTGDYAFSVSANEPVSKNDILVRKLSENFRDSDFGRTDAQNVLNISNSGFHRFIRWAIEEEKIEKIGAGPHTAYKVA